MTRYHFKITRELLFNLEKDFFRKLQRFLGNFRVEGEDYLGELMISFYSNEPIKEGEDTCCNLITMSNKKGSWYFTEIIYFKNK